MNRELIPWFKQLLMVIVAILIQKHLNYTKNLFLA